MNVVFKIIKNGFRLVTDSHYKRDTIIHHRYRVTSFLGIGSFGMTYLCEDLHLNKVCVVKQMTKSKNKKMILAQYELETTTLNLVNHPKIPALFECFSFQNNSFFAMEYMEGRNLEDILFIEKRQFTEKQSLIILQDLLLVVDYIHSMGIIHGDIRIPNVILNGSKISIIDFGLAKQYKNVSGSNESNEIEFLKEDYFDIGDLLLFLLYSNYHSNIKKGRSWTEELTIHPKTSHLLKKLLSIEQPYSHTEEVIADVNQAIGHIDESV